MPASPLVPRHAFIGGDVDQAYLLTAGEGLVPRSALAASERYYVNKSLGIEGRARHLEVEQACRAGLAALLGAGADEVALLGSSSEGLNAVHALIDWRPGDNIVTQTNALEFPSVVLPGVRLASTGVELRAVPHEQFQVLPDEIAAAMDARTRLVVLSHVSYRTGYRHDLEAVAQAVRRRNPDALLAVDATQSLGVVPVAARACDVVVATSCKWLLAPHGIGVFFWNRTRLPEIEPAGIGWYSVVDDLQFPYELKPDASRFELGGPNLATIYPMLEGIQLLLEIGLERLEEHALALSERMLAGLRPLGLPLLTPDDPRQRAGIVAWQDADPPATAAALLERGVVVTGSSGRIRASAHLYNDDEDIDRLVTAMAAITGH